MSEVVANEARSSADLPISPNVKILVVDDEPGISQVIARWLQSSGYACETAANAVEATVAIKRECPAALICDVRMPGSSGMEFLAEIREKYGDEIAVIMITALDDQNTALRAIELGAYGYLAKPFNRNEIVIAVVNALERRRLVLAAREYQRYLEDAIRDRSMEVRRREEEISLRLVSASMYRDDETGMHIRRMGLCAAEVARVLHRDRQQAEDLRVAAPMHDIGKIGVPDTILLKPGKLTSEEFEVMKSHTELGAAILDGSDIPVLQLARDVALSHHEWWNGKGYPRGLSGEDIPLPARIVAVVDVYDALTHRRVYRPAFSEKEALATMSEGKGTQFETRVFDAFMAALPQLRAVQRQFKEEEVLAGWQRQKPTIAGGH